MVEKERTDQLSISHKSVIRTVVYDKKTGETDPASWPYLHCPVVDGKRANIINCMLCDTGHVSECHFPASCEEANCFEYRNKKSLSDHILGLQDRPHLIVGVQ